MAWKKYNSKNKNHSVSEYETGDNFIRCSFTRDTGGFRTGKRYQWTAYAIGQDMIDEMKRCAASGRGLYTYIKRNDLRHQVARTY